MKLASCVAVLLLASASPAFATGTILCRSTTSPAAGPELSLVIGPTGIAQAHFILGGERFTTGESGAPMIGQSWMDADTLRLDIFDANADARLIRLDARRSGSGYRVVLTHGGRTWQVHCSEEG